MSADFHAEATETTPNGLRLCGEGLLRADVLTARRKAEAYMMGIVAPRGFHESLFGYSWLRITPHDWPYVKAVTLRDVIGGTESYTPARQITQQTIAAAPPRKIPSAYDLKVQLRAVNNSSIVLNRAARELAEHRCRNGTTMNELAFRAGSGRIIRGIPTGDQSWLRRRLGIVPYKQSERHPTPWIHDSVLSKIAQALNVAPREIELGAYDD